MLKIVTDADDSGVRKIQRGMGDLEVSTHKASHATKEFLRELSTVSDASDFASVALGSFSKVLGGSLAGTALIIGGKEIIDVFRSVSTIVDKSKESFDSLVEGLNKGGLPSTFQEGSAQASKLSDEIEKINKEIAQLSKGEEALAKGDLKGYFMGLAATITNSTEELIKLREEAKKLANERMLAGAKEELKTAKETVGLSPQEMEQYKLKKQFEQDVDKASVEAGLILLEKYNIDKAAIDDKYYLQKRQKEVEATDGLRKIRMDEFQAEIDSNNRKTAAESAAWLESMEQKKKEQEQIEKIIETQDRLNDLIKKRIDLQEQLKKAQEAETIRQGELATMTAGVGGSLRGPGQRQTSFEIGLKRQADQAYKDQIRKEQENYDQQIANELKAKKQAYDKNAVQNEKVKRAEEAAREKAKKDFEDPYKKQIEKATEALNQNQLDIDKQNAALKSLGEQANTNTESLKNLSDQTVETTKSLKDLADAAKEGKGKDKSGEILDKIYKVLDDTLRELKTYAHAT